MLPLHQMMMYVIVNASLYVTLPDVFLICFSVVSPSSFTNVREKWIPEVRQHAFAEGRPRNRRTRKSPPIVLVGTQSDLREDAPTLVQLARGKEQPVSEQEARKLAAQTGCECYIESSSLTQKNLKEVFDEAIMAGLKGRRQKEKKRLKQAATNKGCSSCCLL